MTLWADHHRRARRAAMEDAVLGFIGWLSQVVICAVILSAALLIGFFAYGIITSAAAGWPTRPAICHDLTAAECTAAVQDASR